MDGFSWTSKKIAEALGLTLGSYEQWKCAYQAKGAIPRYTSNKSFYRKQGVKLFYSNQYFNILKLARNKVRKLEAREKYFSKYQAAASTETTDMLKLISARIEAFEKRHEDEREAFDKKQKKERDAYFNHLIGRATKLGSEMNRIAIKYDKLINNIKP